MTSWINATKGNLDAESPTPIQGTSQQIEGLRVQRYTSRLTQQVQSLDVRTFDHPNRRSDEV
ncbi:hypothetical protein D3C81_2282860 [compost metagenome]